MSLFETILQDFHFALRQLRKKPGFTVPAVAVFALGVAAGTAIFAFVDAALVKPLPYRDPSRLVALFELHGRERSGAGVACISSPRAYGKHGEASSAGC